MVAACWSWMMRAALMHHSGGMPGSFLHGVNLAPLVLVDVALAPARPLGGDARVVLGDDAQRLHERVAEVVERLEAVGARDAAVGILELGVALGGEGVGALVVDHLVGGQDVVVVVDLDIALRDHAVAARVVDQLIGLQVERLGPVDLRARTRTCCRPSWGRPWRTGRRSAGSDPERVRRGRATAAARGSRTRAAEQRRRACALLAVRRNDVREPALCRTQRAVSALDASLSHPPGVAAPLAIQATQDQSAPRLPWSARSNRPCRSASRPLSAGRSQFPLPSPREP